MQLSRRTFLKTSLSSLPLFSPAATVPLWIQKSARAATPNVGNGRRLVIVQMGGGNDGLNTVIPYEDDLYMGETLRPNLHITSGFEHLKLDALNAFHPRLSRLYRWWQEGKLAVVQNVGYPNPNFSHFVATDYWERGNSPGAALNTTQGWISRYVDNQCAGVPQDQIDALTMLAAGMAFLPGTLDGSNLYRPPAVPEFDSYRFFQFNTAAGERTMQYIHLVNGLSTLVPQIEFLQRAANTASASVEDMAAAAQVPLINPYPAGSLGTGLEMVSKVIRGGFETPIFYVTQGGYDTHADQFATDPATTGDHPALLDVFDQALDAFLKDMQAAGELDNVLVLTFSEFGRRVAENFSRGTDHGAGNLLFAMGGKVNSGIFGGQPDLANLVQGSLGYHIDFRGVYARVLRDWLAVDPVSIFGASDFFNPQFNIPAGMEEAAFIGPKVPGDVDGDGRITSADVQHVINRALGKGSPYPTDLNLDGRTDAEDIQRIINLLLGLSQ